MSARHNWLRRATVLFIYCSPLELLDIGSGQRSCTYDNSNGLCEFCGLTNGKVKFAQGVYYLQVRSSEEQRSFKVEVNR